MDEIEKQANYYWQDKLAKFWPSMKGPSTVEVEMFRAGYRLASEENARLREALEWIAADRSMTGETAQGLQRAARDALDGDK